MLSSSDQPRVNFFLPLLKILYLPSLRRVWLKGFQVWVGEQTEPPPQLGCQETEHAHARGGWQPQKSQNSSEPFA